MPAPNGSVLLCLMGTTSVLGLVLESILTSFKDSVHSKGFPQSDVNPPALINPENPKEQPRL